MVLWPRHQPPRCPLPSPAFLECKTLKNRNLITVMQPSSASLQICNRLNILILPRNIHITCAPVRATIFLYSCVQTLLLPLPLPLLRQPPPFSCNSQFASHRILANTSSNSPIRSFPSSYCTPSSHTHALLHRFAFSVCCELLNKAPALPSTTLWPKHSLLLLLFSSHPLR